MKICNTMEINRKFQVIDVCKLIMAFAVIAIHTNPVVNVSNTVMVQLVMTMEDFAVPFFFVASGFFLSYGVERFDDHAKKRFRGYFFKLVRMYGAWTLLSLPLTIYGYYISGDGLFHCILSYIKYFFFVGKLYNSYHLWYLLALIYAVLAISFLLEKNISFKKITLLALLLFAFREVMLWLGEQPETATFVLVKIYQFIFNKGGVFTGMIYVCIGMTIAKRKQYFNKLICLSGLLIINIVQVVSANTYLDDFLNIVEAMLFFMLLLHINLPDGKIYVKCRQVSTIIYLLHLLVFSFYTIVFIKEPNKLGLDSFVFTAIVSSVLAVILCKLSKRDGFGWIGKVI